MWSFLVPPIGGEVLHEHVLKILKGPNGGGRETIKPRLH